MRKNKLWLKITAIAAASLLFTACGSSEFQQILDEIKENTGAPSTTTTAAVTAESPVGSEIKTNIFGIGADDSGSIVINRDDDEPIPMGENGTWSVFLYLCGSDLESDGYGAATDNLKELLDADIPEGVNFVVETGGANSWEMEDISSNKIQRFEVRNKQLNLVDEQKNQNMGDAETLSDFLTWGVANYPAANMAVILWNHGGGPIDGVCFDEKYDYDSLTLSEMNDALLKVSKSMTDKFEIIGFDACLMASIEVASMLVPYADYMVASEQTESSEGWDYGSIASYISDNPYCSGKELSKAICDSYYDKSAYYGTVDDSTISATDLSKIDNLLVKFNNAAIKLAETIDSPSDFNYIAKSANNALFFGDKSYYDGYTNLIDLGNFMALSSEIIGSAADECIEALDDAVIYSKNGYVNRSATGLSFFYPIKIESSETLRTYESICSSPSYIRFVEAASYGSATGSLENFTSAIGGILGGIWNYFTDDSYDSDIWNSYDDYYSEYEDNTQYYDESSTIQLAVEPHLDEDYCYSFTLAQDSIDYVNGIYFDLYLRDDYGDLIYLGKDNNIDIDWDSGVVTDNFYGTWIALDDGQFLTAVVIDDSDSDFTVFSSPVMYNGERASLRYRYTYETKLFTFDGVYLQNENNDAASRMITLSDGDTIVPLYTVCYEDDTEEEFSGDPYTYSSSDSCIADTELNAATYLFSFTITDVFFNDYYTDYIGYDLTEDGELYVNDEFWDYAA